MSSLGEQGDRDWDKMGEEKVSADGVEKLERDVRGEQEPAEYS